MDNVKILVFDEEELTQTLIETYLKELTFSYVLERYSELDLGIIELEKSDKIIIVNINKLNADILKLISKASQDKKNNFVLISYDNSSDISVKALRTGAKDFLQKPLRKSDFLNSLQNIYKKEIMKMNQARRTNVYTTVSAENGAGQSVFLINTAKEIADLTGEKVLLIDFHNDVNDITFMLNMDIVLNTAHYINTLTDENALDLLKQIPKYKKSSLYVMGTGFLRKGDEQVNVSKLAECISVLKKHFRYIFIDKNPDDDAIFVEVNRLADCIFFMLTPNVVPLDTAKTVIESTYINKNVKLIINKYEPKKEKIVEVIREKLGKEIYWKLPKNFMATGGAVMSNKTLKEVAPELDIVKSYIKLAEDIVNRD